MYRAKTRNGYVLPDGSELARKGMTEEKRERFLSTLRETGVVRQACISVRVPMEEAQQLRGEDPGFAEAWDRAMNDAKAAR